MPPLRRTFQIHSQFAPAKAFFKSAKCRWNGQLNSARSSKMIRTGPYSEIQNNYLTLPNRLASSHTQPGSHARDKGTFEDGIGFTIFLRKLFRIYVNCTIMKLRVVVRHIYIYTSDNRYYSGHLELTKKKTARSIIEKSMHILERNENCFL